MAKNSYDSEIGTNNGVKKFYQVTDIRDISYTYNELVNSHNLEENDFFVNLLSLYETYKTVQGNHRELLHTLINGNKIYGYVNVSGSDITVGVDFTDSNNVSILDVNRSAPWLAWGEIITALTFFVVKDTSTNYYGLMGMVCRQGKSSPYVFDNYYSPSAITTTKVNQILEGTIPPTDYHNGAGSGYIGNALLSAKKMVGYNVTESNVESTKTESVETYSATPAENTPKAGNGFAKITWLRDLA